MPEINSELGSRLIGVTEHTLNGDFRHLRNEYYDIPFLSTARIDLKERSDKEIAGAIACEIILHAKQNGKDFLSSNCHEKILLIGYGVMGLHTANKLVELGCRAEIVVNDISDKRKAFAIQDGFSVIRDIKEFLPESDVIILATNVIRGLNPILNKDDLALLKENVFLTSMTSIEDELNIPDLLGSGSLRKVGKEKCTGIYKGPNDQTIQFMLDGCPANTALADGGSSISMSMVEAAGLSGGFYLAHCSAQGLKPERSLPEEVVEMICDEWINFFTVSSPQYTFQNFRPS